MYIRKFIVFCVVLAFVMLFSQRSVISRDGNLVVRIQPHSYIVSQDSIIDFDVEFEGQSGNFSEISLLPKAEQGLANIYNSENDTWVSQNSTWANAPTINNAIKVKIVGIRNKTQLKFKIQNKLDGKIYETEEITIYGRGGLEEYTEKINSNLKTFEAIGHDSEINQKSLEVDTNEINNDSRSVSAEGLNGKYLIMYVAIFLTSAVTGFMVHRYRSKYSKIT